MACCMMWRFIFFSLASPVYTNKHSSKVQLRPLKERPRKHTKFYNTEKRKKRHTFLENGGCGEKKRRQRMQPRFSIEIPGASISSSPSVRKKHPWEKYQPRIFNHFPDTIFCDALPMRAPSIPALSLIIGMCSSFVSYSARFDVRPYFNLR